MASCSTLALSAGHADRHGSARTNVVVGIFAIMFLLSLTVPAIQGAREAGRRNSCFCHGANITVAITNFAGRHGHYPGYLNTLKFDKPVVRSDASVSEEMRVGWVVPILPHLELNDLYRRWTNGDAIANSDTAEYPLAKIRMPILVCPSSGVSPKTPSQCTYAVNTGRQDVSAAGPRGDSPGWPADWAANGVFFNRHIDGHENPGNAPQVEMTQSYITDHDGSSLTLMLSERLDGGSYAVLPASAAETEASLGLIWWPLNRNRPVPRSRRISGPRDPVGIYNARPSSNHPGGVMACFCDGHKRFISENIDYDVYCKLLTPNDAECNDPGAATLVPADDSNNYGQRPNWPAR